jgi:hypothetical protein
VNVEKSNDLAVALEQTYGFKVTGVPTIFFLKPQAKGGKKLIKYEGARTAQALYKEALSHMPDHSRYVTDASLEKFRTQDLPTAILVTEKPTTPPIWKVRQR